MITLALDTSGKSAAVALTVDGQVRFEISQNTGRHHSLILLPAIEESCRKSGVTPGDIDLFALTIGPGSFTGLRIAAGTVKGLSLVSGRPAVGVSTLDALVHPVFPTPCLLCAMLDAQRGQVYAAVYRHREGEWYRIGPERLLGLDELIAALPPEPVLFIGDGAERHHEALTERHPGGCRFAGEMHRHVRAAAVALLGERRYVDGETLDLNHFAPRYLRASEAERLRLGTG
jgi:tRNA threonylcarbamoyladenosine biosynthesis protein TsaB